MNKTIEAIKAGNKVTVGELFQIVNLYPCTHMELMKSGKSVMALQVNQFKEFADYYEFSQDTTADFSKIIIPKCDVVDYESEWNEPIDTLFIYCALKNGMELRFMILFCNETKNMEDYYETDVESVKDFLEDVLNDKNDYRIFFARITDVFGFDLKMNNPAKTYVSTLDDDWKLHIGDDTSVLEISVTDDSVNLFYMKETDHSKEIIVKPYGQPFMEIKLLFFKKN